MSVKKSFDITSEWDGTPIENPLDWTKMDVELTEAGLHISVSSLCYADEVPSTDPDRQKGTWGLWDYEVVELFLVGENGHYTEIEMGPHGHHIVLQLDGPRSIVCKEIPMQWEPLIQDGQWVGRGFVDKKWLPEKIVRANAFTIHTVNGKRRYCCYTPLPGPQPDFHQPDRFALWDDIPTGKHHKMSTD